MIYLDLDRTLFQTSRANEFWPVIESLYPQVDSIRAIAERENYYQQMGDMYFHDVSKQLCDFGCDPVEVYESLLETELADGRFEFEGAKELVTALLAKGQEVSVLTFGSDDYQRFKAALCPSLRELPVITTLRPKYEFLDNLEADDVWVVDDKPIGDEIAGLASFVQVSLEGISVPPDTTWPVFYNLRDVRAFFEEAL